MLVLIKKRDKNVHRFALSAIKGELLEKENERERKRQKKYDKNVDKKRWTKKCELR